jgi:hypothetical protein
MQLLAPVALRSALLLVHRLLFLWPAAERSFSRFPAHEKAEKKLPGDKTRAFLGAGSTRDDAIFAVSVIFSDTPGPKNLA